MAAGRVGAGVLAGLLGFALVGAAQVIGPGSIRGQVGDSRGAPLAGALVSVHSPQLPAGDQFAFTDTRGRFSIPELKAGEYLVRVTKSAFLPVVVSGVRLMPGGGEVLSINLQTAIDFVRQGVRRGTIEDSKQVLRSSPSTRPVLRHNGNDGSEREGLDAPGGDAEPSGYFQVYSSALVAADGPADAVGSQFSLTLPINAGARVRLEGQYTESPDQPRGVGATYEFSSRPRQRSSLAVNLRQGAYFSGADSGPGQREVAVEYIEQIQWSDRVVFQVGATAGRTEGVSDRNYMRPELGAAWILRPQTTVRATYSRRSPTNDHDPIRGREFFDRAVYIPPELEHFSHLELGLTEVLSGAFQVSAGAFRDELGTQAFLIDAEDGTRAFLIVDGRNMPTTGVRVVLDGAFDGFDASLGYTYASAFGFDRNVDSPEDLRSAASRQGFHVVTARVNSRVELTQTEITAVYRWAPGYSLAPVDPYQLFAEYNDPTLSLTVAQDLPSGGVLPGRVQAVLDARNVFEPAFGSHRTVHAGHPRILKGGLHFKF
jgi:hypothetical protein